MAYGDKVLVFEVKGTKAAWMFMQAVRSYHFNISGKVPKTLEFGPSARSQNRLRKQLQHHISPSMDFDRCLLAIFYDPEERFDYLPNRIEEKANRKPALMPFTGTKDDILDGDPIDNCHTGYIDAGIPERMEKELREVEDDQRIAFVGGKISFYKTDRGSVPLALLAANLAPITLSMDKILKIVRKWQIQNKLEEDIPCALYQPKRSPQF